MMAQTNRRSDDLATKLRLLQEAFSTRRFDLAESLCDSIKGTLQLEEHLSGSPHHQAAVSGEVRSVTELPAPWQRWAEGWSSFHAIQLAETVGIARHEEPYEAFLSVPRDKISDPYRELRVARVETDGRLVEVISQVDSVRRSETAWEFEVVFLADVEAHASAVYLLLFGNSNAQFPGYTTDLLVSGEGYGLDIENQFYVARLSRQMGQLERLTIRREHGLELYAGGKGHGEPPTIDWGHDYVDEGGFQKLRMRNWQRCDNYRVTRGPIRVVVRRWGFPHSPVHPLFTPSRVHMDQQYRFYCGLPYFYKQGRMEVLEPLTVEAMRDDEWVFSGYSFTHSLWLDGQGKLHTGEVPVSEQDQLWGVGFYHQDSRDAFIAIRLQHHATHPPELPHGGAPTLHYDGHGQLWSRYPFNHAELRKGASVEQKNAYLMLAYDEQSSPSEVEQLRHQLLHPLTTMPVVGSFTRSRSLGKLARPGEGPEFSAIKAAIWNALRTVRDEQLYETDANIVDLGYVYDVRLEGSTAHITVTMPHRGRPVFHFLEWRGGGRVSDGIRETLQQVDGIQHVIVHFTWDPPWTVSRLTDRGRKALNV